MPASSAISPKPNSRPGCHAPRAYRPGGTRPQPATQSFIVAGAKALNVDVTELTGQPYRGRTANSDRIHAAIPEIRQAVAYWDVPPELDMPPRRSTTWPPTSAR